MDDEKSDRDTDVTGLEEYARMMMLIAYDGPAPVPAPKDIEVERFGEGGGCTPEDAPVEATRPR